MISCILRQKWFYHKPNTSTQFLTKCNKTHPQKENKLQDGPYLTRKTSQKCQKPSGIVREFLLIRTVAFALFSSCRRSLRSKSFLCFYNCDIWYWWFLFLLLFSPWTFFFFGCFLSSTSMKAVYLFYLQAKSVTIFL